MVVGSIMFEGEAPPAYAKALAGRSAVKDNNTKLLVKLVKGFRGSQGNYNASEGRHLKILYL